MLIRRFAHVLMILGLVWEVQAQDISVEIRYTRYGIPHVLAQDERSLGYGLGYAYARDNLCLLAEQVITVRGERSWYLGVAGHTAEGLDNLSSDFFHAWLNRPEPVEAFWLAQPPAIQQRLQGYAAGVNRYLREVRGESLPSSCQSANWRIDIEAQDVIRIMRRLLVEGGAGRFIEPILAATQGAEALSPARQPGPELPRGSNAVAIGAERSASGHTLLLANPHFPWRGSMRFYLWHLTLGDQLDVMGAALPGLPLVNIGFNQRMAWTHTVDDSQHFTLYRLQGDSQHPQQYQLDGQWKRLAQQPVKVRSQTADGRVQWHQRTFLHSDLGVVLAWPGDDGQVLHALADANLENDRVLAQWDAINRADSVAGLRQVLERLQGIPWVNTLAGDDQGQVAYLNHSVVPYLDVAQWEECRLESPLEWPWLVDGSRSRCQWQSDPQAQQRGIVPPRLLPALQTRGYVQHANDSAWLANASRPLEGFLPQVSEAGKPLRLRSRYALEQLQQGGPVSAETLQAMVVEDQVYLWRLIRNDILGFCIDQLLDDKDAALRKACIRLADWSGQAKRDDGVFPAFQALAVQLQPWDQVWRTPFDAKDPLNTPRGLDLGNAEVRKRLQHALRVFAERLPLVSHQLYRQGRQQVLIPGGPGVLGVYNAIESIETAPGEHEVVAGSSYLQLVEFGSQGPQARGLLSFSQSSEPASPHALDQTRLFAEGHWPRLPFRADEIENDSAFERIVLTDRLAPGHGVSTPIIDHSEEVIEHE